MAGKTCLITGATAGIGAAAALELARRGARVVIVGRSGERCGATAASIRERAGNPEVEFLVADLSSQREVRRLAEQFRARHDRLDVLINNAGALFALRRTSADGIEMTLALNHLAGFLLTNLLLDVLRRSAPARIVNVSSDAHKDVGGFDFDDPQALARPRGRTYGTSEFASLLHSVTMPWAHPAFVQYARTKLANLLFTLELADRLKGTGVTANALHPGFVATRFMAGNGALGWFMRCWARVLGASPEQGARTVVHLACAPDVGGVTGRYFVNEQPAPSSPAARDAEAARRLWRLSEELTAAPTPPA
ncbi:MAG: SDR family NAD(P)-dependent oxidoreductase [Phycisphaerae bacterium]|nr:SDR family NAD(P)-dependent oxidoreductase [Phycisphaerae bacterium]